VAAGGQIGRQIGFSEEGCWLHQNKRAGKFSNDMTSTTSKPNPFENVPNEVLDLIISFIPLNKSFAYKKDDTARAIHQIIALMHVSRQFRVAMIQHKVWHGIDFEFENLAAFPTYYKNRKHIDQVFRTKSQEIYRPVSHINLPIRITKLCTLLFSDSCFKETIKKKTRWTFVSIEVLWAVLYHFPTFTESAHTVILNLESIFVGLGLVGECKRLVRLDVLAQHKDSLDLSKIGCFLPPSLTILKVGVPSKCYGTFNFGGLHEFTLETDRRHDDDPFTDSQCWVLPSASGETLTRMNLRIPKLPRSASLSKFTGLKHLEIEHYPADAHLVELIDGLTVGLCSLKGSLKATVEIPYPISEQDEGMIEMDIAESSALLGCLSLARLERICLGICCYPTGIYAVFVTQDFDNRIVPHYIDNCMKAVTKMVEKMKFLEDVELWGGLDVGRVHVLGQLQNLKRLR
jgi:hypothetical protein